MVWEQRWHPLRREWVVISSHRNERPWQGELVPESARALPAYVADCYLCPGNARSSGQRNAAYGGVYVFDNDHPCVGPDAPAATDPPAAIYRNSRARGAARVVCYTPRHDLTLAQLPESEVLALLQALQAQYRELGAQAGVRHVLVFENKGEVVGVSNPHPHCQIYATNFVFKTIELEAQAQTEYLTEHDRPLFQDIVAAEEADGRRLLVRRNQALSFIPYFARYPYETFVAPRETRASLAHLSASELGDFATVLRETLIRLDNLWRMSFPYVMVLHQAPTDKPYPGFHFHIEIHPPLRKPGLLKYLAGPEIGGGNFLNDTAPEEKAAELQAVSSVHYTQSGGEGRRRAARARAADVTTAERLLEPILALHDSIRDAVVNACARQAPEQLAATAGDAGDTIYAIDRVGEETLVRGLSGLARDEPVCVIAEGIADPLILPRGAKESDCRWRLLVDPLDGTRGLMYQKRSAWILTGVAPNRGAATRLSDIVLAVQTEIPLLKQHLSDQLWASRGAGVNARRWNRVSKKTGPVTLRRSGAGTIAHGFATVVRFFPGVREILAAIDDEVVQALVKPEPRRAACFEDQYASTAGELYELMAGHDRFIADLRPLVQSASLPPPLCCHPYDLCTALIALEAGVIIADPSGAAVDAPLDLTTDVAWVGYANQRLRAVVEPVLQAALRRRGLLE